MEAVRVQRRVSESGFRPPDSPRPQTDEAVRVHRGFRKAVSVPKAATEKGARSPRGSAGDVVSVSRHHRPPYGPERDIPPGRSIIPTPSSAASARRGAGGCLLLQARLPVRFPSLPACGGAGLRRRQQVLRYGKAKKPAPDDPAA